MTKLVWDEVGTRRFETGLDRGVLYPLVGDAVPWNGLTAVSDETRASVKDFYLDGIKYLDHAVPGSFAGKVQAFTYPDILDELVGQKPIGSGILAHEQLSGRFHLSYRTLVGNDVDGTDHGYKIHILYNLLAIPGGATFSTLGQQTTPVPFEWTLLGTPMWAPGIRPTSHVTIDSTKIDPALLQSLEETLYGAELIAPELPTLEDLVALAAAV